MTKARKMIRFGSAAALFLAASIPAFADPPALGNLDEIRKFCGNIDDQAADARYALQTRQLTELKADVEERMRALEEKRREYEMWLKRRDEFVSKAQDSLVDIISKMKPEAAAALILKLNPRVSSIILNEMPPEKAAKLARVIVGSQRTSTAPQPASDQRAAAQTGNTVQ